MLLPLSLELLPIFLEHLLLGSQRILLLIELSDRRLGALPEGPDVLHLNVEVKVTADELRVLGIILLVGVEGAELKTKISISFQKRSVRFSVSFHLRYEYW